MNTILSGLGSLSNTVQICVPTRAFHVYRSWQPATRPLAEAQHTAAGFRGPSIFSAPAFARACAGTPHFPLPRLASESPTVQDVRRWGPTRCSWGTAIDSGWNHEHIELVDLSRTASSFSHRTCVFAHAATASVEPVTQEEEEANKKRWQESGGGAGSSDEW